MYKGALIFDFDGTLSGFSSSLLVKAFKTFGIKFYRPLSGLIKTMPQVAGASDTLSLLRNAGYWLGIVSDRPYVDLDMLLQRVCIPCGVFHFVQGTLNTFPRRKPDPRVFYDVRALLSANVEKIYYIGDDVKLDYPAARGIGFNFVGVLTGLGTREQFLRAGVPAENIIDSVAQLPNFLGVTEEQANEAWAEAYK